MTAVAIVVVGDELLSGRRRDGNGVWLAQALHARGIPLQRMHIVGDDEAHIAAAIQTAATEADLVVVGGGLGPTTDDRTRAGVAQAAGTALVHDDGAWASVVACHERRGRQPQETARRQALVPAGARWLTNDTGTAPGLEVSVGAARVVVLPGVPHEWRAMCHAHVLPTLAAADEVSQTSVWVAGVPESEVAARLEGLAAVEVVELASYPHEGEVELRFRATGPLAEPRAAAALDAARGRLGLSAFEPPPGGAIEHVVVAQLRDQGLRLATAESITGGLLARMVTSVPGASAVFPAGWVTYETAQKTTQLGVPEDQIVSEGVVSEAVARSMAEGALARAGADVALATTGTAGPDPLEQPGHAPVPPGRVHAALARAGAETRAVTWHLPFERTLVQRHAAVGALDLLRRALAEGALSPPGR